jgi:ribose 5-phosphate isomerase B
MSNNIYIASDHAGFFLKNEILKTLNEILIDMGTDSAESVDYPDFSSKLVDKILTQNNSKGILICGSGIGMSIAANRNRNIRAGIAFNSEVAKLMRKHNDANVLVLPGRFINVHEALKCIDNFLYSDFEFGRHEKRIKKIDTLLK